MFPHIYLKFFLFNLKVMKVSGHLLFYFLIFKVVSIYLESHRSPFILFLTPIKVVFGAIIMAVF